MHNNKYRFIIYNQIEVVAGKEYALILDFQRSKVFKISIRSYIFLKELTESQIDEKNLTSNQDFITQLETLEVGFLSSNFDSFPNKVNGHYTSKVFDNAVIEVDKFTDFKTVKNFVLQLIKNHVAAVAVSFIDFRIEVLELLNELSVKSATRRIDLFVNVTTSEDFNNISSVLEQNGRFVLNYYSDCEDFKWNKNYAVLKLSSPVVVKTKATSALALNRLVYNEALTYNVGINRKVCLSKEGELKNYLTHEKTFGSPDEIDIKKLLDNDFFVKYWNVNNDLVEYCKDCALRYNCINSSEVVKVKGKFFRSEYCTFIEKMK